MPSLSKIRDNVESDLEEQVAYLRKEVASLTKALSKRGASVLDDTRGGAADLYQEVAGRIADAIPVLRKQAKAANRSVHDNPAVAAMVGIAVVGLVISLFARR
jgi:ElaB/YqjD/DUF883 family membrane-anchored ribosome-binding protein